MKLIIERRSGGSLTCKGNGPKAKLLCSWLENDIQALEDNALTAFQYIELSDNGEDQFWGGNAFLVDFHKHKILLKYQYGNKEEYEYSKMDVVNALKEWLRKIRSLNKHGQ